MDLRGGWRFPHVPLTPSDERKFFEIGVGLRQRDPRALVRSCLQLKELALADFPPEVFLQRPEALLQLVSIVSATAGGPTRVSGQAMVLEMARQRLRAEARARSAGAGGDIPDGGMDLDFAHLYRPTRFKHFANETSSFSWLLKWEG